MQKKIIALAIAGLSATAAFAQSNVTIYGIIDTTFDNVKRSDSVAAQTANDVSFNRVSYNSSYIGFKGAEDLGNGLKAVFQLEVGVDPAAGAALSLSRDSYGGVAGGFGTLVAGQLTGPTRALGASVDVNEGATGIGANIALIGKLGNNLTNLTTDANGNAGFGAAGRSQTQASTFDTRWKNSVAYISPNFSGFTGVIAYVANENKLDGAAGVNTSGWDLGVNYANGPLTVGVAYNPVRLENNANVAAVSYNGVNLTALGTDIKTDAKRIGATYDFGVVKVAALYDRVNLRGSALDLDQNVWGLGLTVPVSSAGKVIGQYYKAGNVSGLAGDRGAKFYELGYVHSLSKRTSVRAVYAHLDNETNANYDFGVNAVGNGVAGAGAGTTISGFQFGIRHSF